jgi:hypothetical protein
MVKILDYVQIAEGMDVGAHSKCGKTKLPGFLADVLQPRSFLIQERFARIENNCRFDQAAYWGSGYALVGDAALVPTSLVALIIA